MKKVVIIIVFAAAAAAAIVLSVSIDKSLELAVDAKIKNECELMVNKAMEKAMADMPELCDILKVEKDQMGAIAMVSVESTLVNRLTVLMTEELQKGVAEMGRKKIVIPMGNIMMSRLFSGMGPDIEVEVYPLSSCGIDYSSSFTQTGINQSLFTLFAQTELLVDTRVGIYTYSTAVTRKTAVCNIIIVGEVPDTYANLLSGSDFLNLTPAK